MKLHELFENRPLMENSVTLEEVKSLKDLIDPSTGKYYTGEVNVTGSVDLIFKELKELPVKFGIVHGAFWCMDNQIKTLKGAPREVHGSFECSHNELSTLEDAPKEVHRNFYCQGNELTSLQGIHKIIKKIGGLINLSSDSLKSGGIGLILIEGLVIIDQQPARHPAFKIINKYLGQGKKGVLLCQDELIDAGYEEFAKL